METLFYANNRFSILAIVLLTVNLSGNVVVYVYFLQFLVLIFMFLCYFYYIFTIYSFFIHISFTYTCYSKITFKE